MADEWFSKQSIGWLPAYSASRWGPREALVYRDQRWTFHELDEAVDRYARALLAIGIAPGERVALFMPNRPDFMLLFYAVLKIGAIIVPLNTRYRRDDLGYVLRQSRCRTLLIAERSDVNSFLDLVVEFAGPGNGAPELQRTILFGDASVNGTVPWNEVLERAATITQADLETVAAAVDPDSPAMILYTSGTTGAPKGVILKHIGVRICEERGAIWGITPADTQLSYMPLFHMYAIGSIVMTSALRGARQILFDAFNGVEALRMVEAERATIIHGFDTHWRDMLAAQREHAFDLSSLRYGMLSVGPDDLADLARDCQTELCPTVTVFGLTENWGPVLTSFLDSPIEDRTGASGYPLPGVEVRIIDPDTGLERSANTPGEVLIRSYTTMTGYNDDPVETAKAIDEEGWLHTGDMGLLRPNGHMKFMGRYKDMLKVGGENVSPLEVEMHLAGLEGVKAVVVVGYPDQRLKEVPVAVIVRQPDADLSAAAVLAHCKGRIASFKTPRHVVFVPELPMTSTGKVRKAEIRESLLTVLGEPT